MSNWYAEVIDILEARPDGRELLLEIAKANPKIVVLAAKRLTEKAGGWQWQAKRMMALGEKIAAIKICKAATGMSLQDSKAAVEALMSPQEVEP